MKPRFKPKINRAELFSFFNLKKVEDFEVSFAHKASSKYSLAFGYGRTAIYIALKALDIENKKVICPAYTCVVVAHAIKYSDNIPVFIDSTECSYNMSNLKILEEIEKNPMEVGSVIFTSIFGEPVDTDFVLEIKKKYPHILIIQDCAHSFFASWNNVEVQNVGDIAIYGLNISKIIHTVFGGVLSTNSIELYTKIKDYRNKELSTPNSLVGFKRIVYYYLSYIAFTPLVYGVVNYLDRKGILGGLTQYYNEGEIDMPSDYLVKMTNSCAKVGIKQLNKYDSIIAERRDCAQYYFDSLSKVPNIILPPSISGSTYSHYVIRVEDRDALLKYCLGRGIQLGWLIEYSIPFMKAYKSSDRDSKYSVSKKYSQQAVNLPVYDLKTARTVSTILIDYFNSSSLNLGE